MIRHDKQAKVPKRPRSALSRQGSQREGVRRPTDELTAPSFENVFWLLGVLERAKAGARRKARAIRSRRVLEKLSHSLHVF